MSFKFVEDRLETTVKSKFPSLDFENVLENFTSKLIRLRNIIYSIKVVGGISDGAVWNEMRIQCMMMLFLNYIFDVCFVDFVVTAANNDEIELQVIDIDDQPAVWKGTTDLKCSHRESTAISEATATLEMKMPFNNSDPRLFKSKALQPKQQLLGQAMGLNSKLSYLTDIFAVSVMYHLNEGYYLSERVTDARKFCLRLLLMRCGDLSSEEWISLMDNDTCPVDLSDDDGAEQQVSSDSSVALRGVKARCVWRLP